MSMGIQGYLAMTGAEFSHIEQLCFPAWMSCHFSPWGTGLTNFPPGLPQGSMLILDDSIPPAHHDVLQIAEQLTQNCKRLQPDCVLLDFQRPKNPKTMEICQALVSSLPCPVGVSQLYAKDLSCPVLLECPAPGISLEAVASAFTGRELWLEIAPEGRRLVLTEKGCQVFPEALDDHKTAYYDTETASHYHWYLESGQAIFHIWRDIACLQKLISQANDLHFAKTIGLYQQLGPAFFQ